MKKHTPMLLFSTIFLSLLLICCTDKQAKPEKEILGKWEFVKVIGDVVSSDSATTAKLKEGMKLASIGKDLEGNTMNLTFAENGILTINNQNPATYSINNNKLRIRVEGTVLNNDFKLDGDSLIIHFNLRKCLAID